MNFNKIKSSEKFEYMMLSRLIQDAKYFIDYPDLKHLWARTLDKHIKQMKEQYVKLDPKPEWTSLEEIENLARQMKEAYKNHWNEVHPDNKIKSSEQPTTPKPTEVLPTNMQWAWEPKANTWIAVMKDNPVVTPPTYNPNNQNVINQTTSYMSNIKSSSKKVKSFYDIKNLNNIKMELTSFGEIDDLERFELDGIEFYKAKDEELENAIDVCLEEEFMPDWEQQGLLSYTIDSIDYNEEDKQGVVHIDLNWGNDKINTLNKQSSCLTKFLDGPQYSKEIKIEAGLIKKGLVKYAGFDFNRGTKYVITDKGLKFLKAYKEQELNEAQNEREKLAYLFGFNTNDISTLDTTGKVIKNSKKWTICEADGTELGEVEADSELDAKVKFGIKNPEYADSQSICAKEVKAGLEYGGAFEYNDYKIDLFNDTDGGATFVIYAPKGKTVNHESMYKGTASTMDEAITKAYNIIDGSKEIDAKYEETTEQHLDYPNPSETPHDDVIIENHTGWVNTAGLKNKSVYRKLFILAKMLEDYRKKELIQPAESEDDNIEIITGDAKTINELEHKIKDLGFYCESVLQSELPETGLIYSLKIFLDEE